MAKYVSINELDKFHLHDAEFAAVYEAEGQMIWMLDFVNVKKENSQSSYECDMEAGLTKITFYDFRITRFEIVNPHKWDASGKIVVIAPYLTIPHSDYPKHFLSFVEDGGNIQNHCECINDGTLQLYNFFISTGPEVYNLDLEFSKVVVEWDDFKSKAWYVK